MAWETKSFGIFSGWVSLHWVLDLDWFLFLTIDDSQIEIDLELYVRLQSCLSQCMPVHYRVGRTWKRSTLKYLPDPQPYRHHAQSPTHPNQGLPFADRFTTSATAVSNCSSVTSRVGQSQELCD